jgi:hypothetical protein
MQGLGRIYDVQAGLVSDWASGQVSQRISLKNASGVTFLCIAASADNTPDLSFDQHDAFTSGNSKDLPLPAGTKFHRKAHASAVPGTWTEVAGVTADLADGKIDDIFLANTGGVVAVYIDASWLDVDNGFAYVSADIDDGISNARQGILVAIVHPLVQRSPANMPSLIA